MSTDLAFITNEGSHNLKTRFEALIKDTRFFDCLVGYFYTSGFFNIYKPLENADRIRVLIGISTDRRSFDLMRQAQEEFEKPKIVYPDIATHMRAVCMEDGGYAYCTTFIMPFDPYMLALMHSKLFDWYYRLRFQSLGDLQDRGRIRF